MTTGAFVAGPTSIEAEQSLLGAILLNADAFAHAATLVRPEHFSEGLHARIYDVMSQLLRADRQITPVGILAHIGDYEIVEGVTTKTYLARLASAATPIVLVPEYARVIRDAATRRALIGEAHALAASASDAKIDRSPDEIAAATMESLRLLLADAPQDRIRFDLGDGAADFVDRVERIRRGEEQPREFRTGFPDLDRQLGGLHPGTIVLVAARVGMGKTILMTNLAYAVARRNENVGVVEFSLEIPADELIARHLSALVFDRSQPIPFGAIKSGGINDAEAERVIDTQRELRRLPIISVCPPKITAAEIAGRIQIEKRAMAAKGITLGVVLIDYLDKISASERYAGQRTYEIQEIVTALKSVARSEEICLVLLAQLNRGTEGREDKRPSLADLKSSSFLEQEAHAVIFVYREAYYLLKSAEFRECDEEARKRFDQVQNHVELIIGKNRSGPEGTVHLWGDVASSYLASAAP